MSKGAVEEFSLGEPDSSGNRGARGDGEPGAAAPAAHDRGARGRAGPSRRRRSAAGEDRVYVLTGATLTAYSDR